MDGRDDMPTMTYPTTVSEQTDIEVTGGVDTRKDTHTAAALDASGRLLGHREFAATRRLGRIAGLAGHARAAERVGVEGSPTDRRQRLKLRNTSFTVGMTYQVSDTDLQTRATALRHAL